MATVFIPPLLRELTGGVDRVAVSGTTVRQVVAALNALYPGIRERLCTGDELRPGLSVAVNGAVSSLGLLQKVPDGSEVHFLPAVGGG
ncbi:MAG: molybdopterin synthase sulfur carrier subunit [Planctomycetaceae bacterium]|nr:molybdopterin synthase sulfur carrier subunit [Planctomycetaceae bacterium]